MHVVEYSIEAYLCASEDEIKVQRMSIAAKAETLLLIIMPT
jgi:hypothetical protein